MALFKKLARQILSKELKAQDMLQAQQTAVIEQQVLMLEQLRQQFNFVVQANHSMKHMHDSMAERLRNRLH